MSNFWLDIFASGIDFNLPGNGGPDCLAHTSFSGRALESTVSIITFTTALVAALKVNNLFQKHYLILWIVFKNIIYYVVCIPAKKFNISMQYILGTRSTIN